MSQSRQTAAFLGGLIAFLLSSPLGFGQYEPWSFILPEQRRIEVRRPEQLPHAPLPSAAAPVTVVGLAEQRPERPLSLTEAINVGLGNMDVVRVLGGVVATGSGRTIYDVAINNTRIDQQRGVFDPTLNINNAWTRNETPTALFDPLERAYSSQVGGGRCQSG
jgi:hypothetical protein